MYLIHLSIATTLAQLSGRVGHTSKSPKQTTCNVKEYFPRGSDDVGQAIQAAFDRCVQRGNALLLIPQGTYTMRTWVTLRNARNWGMQLDGTILRGGDGGGHMFVIQDASDFEIYSRTAGRGGGGVVQGYGYKFHRDGAYGPRIMRIVRGVDFSVHDVILVDSPAFHLVIDNCRNAELYNIVIRGGWRGGLDGINLSGSNIHVHHVEVTNKDECVTTKSPASNFLVENIYCNWSGGCTMGSFSEGTRVRNIVYRNIYTVGSNVMFMIKSKKGNGMIDNVRLENFIGHSNAYGFNIDQHWYATGPVFSAPKVRRLFIKDWYASSDAENTRPVFKARCLKSSGCQIRVQNFNFWKEDGGMTKYQCEAAYGQKFGCMGIKAGQSTAVKMIPSRVKRAKRLSDDLQGGLGITREIEIPRFPQRYFPE